MKFTATRTAEFPASPGIMATVTYAVSFGPATMHIDVHPNGMSSATNFGPKAAKIIARELVARYVAACGNWPKTHTFEVK